MHQQLLPGFPAPSTPTLDNFVAGDNVELLATLHALAAGQARERFIYLWGESGSGKSHLLEAVANAAQAHGIDAVCSHVPSECSGFRLVALDDADRLDEAAQIDLFNLYNRLRDGDGCLLASGAQPPAQLAVRPDLATRLGWGRGVPGARPERRGKNRRHWPRTRHSVALRCPPKCRAICCATGGATCPR